MRKGQRPLQARRRGASLRGRPGNGRSGRGMADTDRLRARGAGRDASDRGLRQRRQRATTAAHSSATSGAPTVDASGKPSGELTISNWPLYIDKQTIPDFEDEDRAHGQVHRGRQRQRRVLRQGAAAARPGRVRWPLDLRRHRLDGEQDARARLPAELRQVGDAEQPRELRAEPRRTRRSTSTATTRCRGRRG